VRVAVGVIRNAAGEILVAHRQAHLHQGGLWEFPGGKIHAGESCREALCRELHEELDIRVEVAAPLIEIEHAYIDKRVRLEVWNVTSFRGDPRGMQGQPIAWRHVDELDPAHFPAANAAIIRALRSAEPDQRPDATTDASKDSVMQSGEEPA
jgi:8-oxo-dGTP diphosphatase